MNQKGHSWSFFRRDSARFDSLIRWTKACLSAVILAATLLFLVYPAVMVLLVVTDARLKQTGESRYVAAWFRGASRRFQGWATHYLDSRYARCIHPDDVAATEWPMFGAVFYLLTAETLDDSGQCAASNVGGAIQKAVEIVVSPDTATWVREKWGDSYLANENVFYRMLLIMGLSAYERLTGDLQYRPLMSEQRQTLSAELLRAPYHLRCDYPGECYPNDVLWAVAAIIRAGRLEGIAHDDLARSLMDVLQGPLMAEEGLPAFQADAWTGIPLQDARGCGNSGILLFAPDLDPAISLEWYEAHVKHFWQHSRWISGFRELPIGDDDHFMDVDSGPVMWGIGSVASAFGIGAARRAGRADHAAPLVMEAVACSWPTPFGFAVPGLLGWFSADSWSLGEMALLFSMTRPVAAETITPFTGAVPGIVWLVLASYLAVAALFITCECRALRHLIWRPIQKSQGQ